MNKEQLKLFTVGYYVDFIIDNDEELELYEDINTYSLEEVINLGFCGTEPLDVCALDFYDKHFEELSFDEKADVVVNYVNDDKLAGIHYFSDEEDAAAFKTAKIKELKDTILSILCINNY